MGTQLRIDIPDDLKGTLKALGYSTQRLSDEARSHLASALYSRKTLSLGQAARLAGMPLWDFIPFLGKQGITLSDYDKEETQIEIESAQWLSKKKKK